MKLECLPWCCLLQQRRLVRKQLRAEKCLKRKAQQSVAANQRNSLNTNKLSCTTCTDAGKAPSSQLPESGQLAQIATLFQFYAFGEVDEMHWFCAFPGNLGLGVAPNTTLSALHTIRLMNLKGSGPAKLASQPASIANTSAVHISTVRRLSLPYSNHLWHHSHHQHNDLPPSD